MDDSLLEFFFCHLFVPGELCLFAPVCSRWRCALDPRTRLPWRTVLLAACPGVSVDTAEEAGHVAVVARLPGISVTLEQQAPSSNPAELFALPLEAPALGATPAPSQGVAGGSWDQVSIEDWPLGLDYLAITRQLSGIRPAHRVATGDANTLLPACPLCAAVAFYQGPQFTRADIETGWHAYLLCSDATRQPHAVNPILATLWANSGIPIESSPPIAIQLRPHGREACDSEMGTIRSFAELWRGRGSAAAAMYILSAAFECSKRLYISGIPLSDYGVDAFFCDQVGKYARTSRTRVGRYLDDQPARTPRAHIFGACRASQAGGRGVAWPPRGALGEADSDAELCPYCGCVGVQLLSSAISVAVGEPEERELQPLHGAVWLCQPTAMHLWGWRARQAGAPVAED